MPDLRELQLGMFGAITAEPAPEAPAVEAEINGDARLHAAGRLQIYANMYRVRLQDALATTFPTLAAILYDDDLTELSADYVAAHPSRHPSLRWVGKQLPDFLRGREPAWLADLAALDWARHDVHDAADEPILEAAALAGYAPETVGELPLRLAGAHRLVRVAHAVEAVFRAVKAEKDHETPAAEPRLLLVWRDGVNVYHRRVASPVEEHALRLAAGGLTFAELCERLTELVGADEAARHAGELVGRWVGDHLLVRLGS